ncbi:uncharacterized protein LOC9642578 isoform X1 [Selaginella moellendorffii]|uniref:uncharacterized protein LOC9642578 isoform X1 n=1 Tax=Selaginella moellendorffii TaxID=88036 RepID=UPI000D1C57C4|nr:uncharacterized protein LOC9642578 isoform X1 [Selaginella moellendorffii]|eukprot:XP_024534309.1 uncharacterized protein LOC9642578 isoform X1 [Selaginella moellendorffii]
MLRCLGRRARVPALARSQVRCISDEHWFTYDEDLPAPSLLLPPNAPKERATSQEGLEGGVLYRLPSFLLVFWTGDISQWRVPGQRDAIVAPANKKLNAGIGVNRAIHNAAGPSLAEACAMLKSLDQFGVKCRIGNAVVTKAYRLPLHRIIHAVGPAYDGAEETPTLLAQTYRRCLQRAKEIELECLAFPPISCGVYGYPVREGARIALQEIKDPPSCINEVRSTLFSVIQAIMSPGFRKQTMYLVTKEL